LGLSSSGIHSNGYSLVRKVLTEAEMKRYSKDILKPTKIYVKTIISLIDRLYKETGKQIVKGIAHNTGGAFYEKLTKILPKDLGFKVYKNSWTVPQIFKLIQKKSDLDDKEMYSTFNMGVGLILVVDKKHVDLVRRYISKKSEVFAIGEVIKSSSNQKMNLL